MLTVVVGAALWLQFRRYSPCQSCAAVILRHRPKSSRQSHGKDALAAENEDGDIGRQADQSIGGGAEYYDT